MSTYTANITREGKWWMVAVPQIDGLTQARRLSEAADMARELVAVELEVPISSVEIELNLQSVGAVKDINKTIRRVEADRQKANELEREASALMVKLAKDLAKENVPLRDVGTVLGVTYQRAHQLATA